MTRALQFTLLLAGAGCASAKTREVVHRWLLCVECGSGELNAVVALGNRAIPPLRDALRGLTVADSTAAVARMAADYAALVRWRNDHPAPAQPMPDSATYVNGYITKVAQGYQARAVVAITRLQTPEATAAFKLFMQSESHRLHPAARHLADSLLVP